MQKLKEYEIIIIKNNFADCENNGLYGFNTFGKKAKKDGKKFAEFLETNACYEFIESLKNNL